jgi:hypothetical protein
LRFRLCRIHVIEYVTVGLLLLAAAAAAGCCCWLLLLLPPPPPLLRCHLRKRGNLGLSTASNRETIASRSLSCWRKSDAPQRRLRKCAHSRSGGQCQTEARDDVPSHSLGRRAPPPPPPQPPPPPPPPPAPAPAPARTAAPLWTSRRSYYQFAPRCGRSLWLQGGVVRAKRKG